MDFVNLSFFLLVSSIPAFVGKVIFTETKAAMLTNVLLCLCYNLFFYYKMYYDSGNLLGWLIFWIISIVLHVGILMAFFLIQSLLNKSK